MTPQERAEIDKILNLSWPPYHVAGEDGTPLPFHLAQIAAMESRQRIICMSAGSQSGKTSFGPHWLKAEIDRTAKAGGGNDYGAVTASYDLFKLKMLPSFLYLFEEKLKLGRYWTGDKVFELADPSTNKTWAKVSTDPMWGRVILRSAQSQGGLESATMAGLWLDEAGQDEFELGAWQALKRRVALRRGRVLITTTLYNLGWLAQQVIDVAIKLGAQQLLKGANNGEIEIHSVPRQKDPWKDICLIQFDSIVNPLYSLEEYQSAMDNMAEGDFQMQYRGRTGQLRYLIYNSLNFQECVIESFEIPGYWRVLLGVDFGGAHTCGAYYAEDPDTGKLYCFREYLNGKRETQEHARAMMQDVGPIAMCYGGAAGEDQFRTDFSAGGLRIGKPEVTDVEAGISVVYGTHRRNQIYYFKDKVPGIIDQKGRYKRKRDPNTGEVLNEIDNKKRFHYMDAERYIISQRFKPLLRPGGGFLFGRGANAHVVPKSPIAAAISAALANRDGSIL